MQLLLYYGILQYNFQLSPKNSHIELLYSKYPLPDGLLEVEPLQKLIREAIRFRNQAVATEFWMAENGLKRYYHCLTPQTLNTEKHDDPFYKRYLLPPLIALLAPLHQLNELERAYFTRMMTFVIKEQLVSKVGVQEGVGSSNADLWNMPLAEKKETGNIYTGLTIIEKERSSSFNGYDTITLSVPQQGEDFLPNFRRGDMIYLYAYKKKEALTSGRVSSSKVLYRRYTVTNLLYTSMTDSKTLTSSAETTSPLNMRGVTSVAHRLSEVYTPSSPQVKNGVSCF